MRINHESIVDDADEKLVFPLINEASHSEMNS